MTISNFSTTASNNTSINGVSIAEGMSPSDVNNALREYSKDLRTVWNDKEWFLLGSGNQTVTYTRASATSVTINADVSSTYHVGRRVKVVGTATGTLYGKIATSSYSSPNTTVTFTFDSGSINSGDTTVSVFVGSVFNNPSVPVIDTDAMTEDSAILPPSQQSVKAFVESGTVTMTNKTLTSPVLNTSLSGTAFKDEDNMSSNSATAVASQQSIKAYVDTQITAQDLDITTDSGNIDIDLDSESLTLTGGTGIDTSATGSTVTHAIDSTVATLTGTQTLTNKTINAPTITGDTTMSGDLAIDTDTFTVDSSLDQVEINGYLTVNGSGVDVNTTIFPNGILMEDSKAISFGSGSDFELRHSITGGDDVLNLNLKDTDNHFGIYDGLTELVRFTGTGKVGIGTASPSTKLHVNGDITADNGNITVSDGSNSTAINLGGTLTFDSNNFSESSGTVSVKTAGIGNTQVATGIDATKIADGSVSNTEFQYINSLSSNAQTQLTGKLTASNNLSDVSSASTSRSNLGLGTISTQASNNVSITGGAISGLSLPTADTEASSKLYVDNAIAGMRTRIITKVATTGNVNLTNGLENGDSIDGITLQTGDKILVKSQTDATENGIYISPSSGSASRDTNYDTVEELAGQMIVVQQGSTNADKIFLCTTDNSGSIGSVDIVFSQVTPANQGTVQSVAVADAGSSEFTITGSPITSSGTINLAVNSINATKIGSGNVDNTELGYLNGVTSNIQTQLDNSASLGDAISFAVALGS